MASRETPSFPVEFVSDGSVLKCYMLRSSSCAFLVKTPQLGYEAIFLRLDDDVLEPDMLLTMHHHNKIHKIPWLSPFLQNRAYARLNNLLSSYPPTNTINTPHTLPAPPHNLPSRAPASSSSQNQSLEPDLARELQTALKPWPEPVGYHEAMSHLLGWLWGVGTMLQLEGRTEGAKTVEKMVREIEQRFKIKSSSGGV